MMVTINQSMRTNKFMIRKSSTKENPLLQTYFRMLIRWVKIFSRMFKGYSKKVQEVMNQFLKCLIIKTIQMMVLDTNKSNLLMISTLITRLHNHRAISIKLQECLVLPTVSISNLHHKHTSSNKYQKWISLEILAMKLQLLPTRCLLRLLLMIKISSKSLNLK